MEFVEWLRGRLLKKSIKSSQNCCQIGDDFDLIPCLFSGSQYSLQLVSFAIPLILDDFFHDIL